MKNIVLLFLLIFSCLSIKADEIKIATFNVENLFDGKNNGSEYSDFIVGKSDWSEKRFEDKVSKICKYINQLNPQIIGLQEIENNNVMSHLANRCGYDYFAFTKPIGSPVGVGIMSKLPISSHKAFEVKGVKTRNILKADFTFNDKSFSVFVNHFPAGGDLNKKRLALSVLKIAIKDVKNAIILGDFNSDFNKNFILNDLMEKNDFRNLWDYNPGYGSNSFKRSLTEFDRKFRVFGYKAKNELPASHVTGKDLDHILLSKSFFDKDSSFTYKDDSFGVFVPPGYFDNENPLSDHRAIYFTLISKISTGAMKHGVDNHNDLAKKNMIYEIYSNNPPKAPFVIEKAVVIYKDKKGVILWQNGCEKCSINDEKSRGIFAFGKTATLLKLGNVVDIIVKDVTQYYENLELRDINVLKYYDDRDIKEFIKKNSDFKNFRQGDVVDNLKGDVINNKINTDFGKILLYKKGGIRNGYYNFNNVLIKNYKGSIEGVLD